MQSAWTCGEHGPVAPLHAARPGTSEQLAHLAAKSMVPVWLPWPLPPGWLTTGFRYAGDDRTGPVASVVALSGPNPLPGHGPRHQPAADLLLVAEQPAVGLGASLAGLPGGRRRRLAVRRAGGGRPAGQGPGRRASGAPVERAGRRRPCGLRRRGARRVVVADHVATQRRRDGAGRAAAGRRPRPRASAGHTHRRAESATGLSRPHLG